MIYEQDIVHKLYRRLLTLYPRTFHAQLGESMEQTFHDLWNEKRQTRKELFGFVVWTFIETTLAIARERLLALGQGDIMQAMLKTTGISVLMSFGLIVPFMIMEVVNRRHLNEDFPVALFFVMWLNLFAISLILLPIMRSRRTTSPDLANSAAPPQGTTLLTNPKSAAVISVFLILFPFILTGLDSLSWVPMDLDRLFNGPNPEVNYPPGQIIALFFFSIPIAGGLIASGPIVRSLRAGGSLFAYPIHLIIVVLIVSAMAFGIVSLIIDQWPCFMGVPNCD